MRLKISNGSACCPCDQQVGCSCVQGNASIECRSRSGTKCCVAGLSPIPAHVADGGVTPDPAAPDCDFTFPAPGPAWRMQLVAAGPGSTPGTTKLRMEGAASYNGGGVPLRLDGISTPHFSGYGEERDVAWGYHVPYFYLVFGIGNPFSCSGGICVESFDGDWSGSDLCSARVASLATCEMGDVVRARTDVQVRAYVSGITVGELYLVRISFSRRAIGSADPFVYFADSYQSVASLTPAVGGYPGEAAAFYTGWENVPNSAGFETVCSAVTLTPQ